MSSIKFLQDVLSKATYLGFYDPFTLICRFSSPYESLSFLWEEYLLSPHHQIMNLNLSLLYTIRHHQIANQHEKISMIYLCIFSASFFNFSAFSSKVSYTEYERNDVSIDIWLHNRHTNVVLLYSELNFSWSKIF